MANPEMIKSFVAEAAVAKNTIVKFGTADGQVVPAAAATDALVGVADELGQASAGGRVDVILEGTADVVFGGTVTRGAMVTANASGQAVAAAPAAGVNNRVIGIALVSAVSGDIGPILIEQGSLQG